jgi:beta-lactamase class A
VTGGVLSFLALWVTSWVFAPPADLGAQMRGIARAVDGRVGASALLVETVELVSLNGRQSFPMQSVYKVPIAIAVLQRVDAGRLRLDQPVRVERSDIAPAPLYSPLRKKHPRGDAIAEQGRRNRAGS